MPARVSRPPRTATTAVFTVGWCPTHWVVMRHRPCHLADSARSVSGLTQPGGPVGLYPSRRGAARVPVPVPALPGHPTPPLDYVPSRPLLRCARVPVGDSQAAVPLTPPPPAVRGPAGTTGRTGLSRLRFPEELQAVRQETSASEDAATGGPGHAGAEFDVHAEARVVEGLACVAHDPVLRGLSDLGDVGVLGEVDGQGGSAPASHHTSRRIVDPTSAGPLSMDSGPADVGVVKQPDRVG